jgi:Ca2+-binding RTX toxin-like protein
MDRGDNHTKVEVIQSKIALSTGPGLTNPALKCARGFNEFYYVLHNPDVATKIQSGKLKDGLTHFLATGQHEGRFGFAAGAHVVGSDKADSIKLREGNETADGRLGNDKVKGGAGADTFVFSTKLGAANVDTIKGFKPWQGDLIALDAAIFRKIGAALDDGEFYAASGAVKAHDRSDRIIYDTKTGKLSYDVDGTKTGGHDAVHFATLSNKPALDVDHFVIV